jgi:lysophospholipase L1-like esterase
MKHKLLLNLSHAIIALLLGISIVGCEDGGGGGSGDDDIGDNNPNVIVSLGDSITEGMPDGGAPFPSRLAGMTGKTVVNQGRGGETSGSGASRAKSVLQSHKPASMTILYGANDLIHGGSMDTTIGNLRSIIAACRDNRTIPVLATLTPMIDGHETWAGGVVVLNDMIRELASNENVDLVDLEREFGSNAEMLLLPDGLHPNDEGNQVVAGAFAGSL